MAFLESKCEYSDGERIPIRPATSRKVTADSPSRRAISHAASTISRRVASRRSARLSRLGKALKGKEYVRCAPHCQGPLAAWRGGSAGRTLWRGLRGDGGILYRPLVSDRDQLHVDGGCPGQLQQVAGVGGEDVVPTPGEADHRSVDRVGATCQGQQHPRQLSQL